MFQEKKLEGKKKKKKSDKRSATKGYCITKRVLVSEATTATSSASRHVQARAPRQTIARASTRSATHTSNGQK